MVSETRSHPVRSAQAEQRAGALVEIPGAPVGLQREDVGGIAGIGKAQLAQLGDGRVAAARPSRPSATPVSPLTSAGKAGAAPPSGSRSKVEAVIHKRGGGGEDKADHRDPGDLDMQPARERSAQRREPAPPAARAPRDQRRAGQRQDQHRRRPRRHGDAARHRPGTASGAGWSASVRPGSGRPRRRPCPVAGSMTAAPGAPLIEPVGGDPARRRAADLLDARIGGLDARRRASATRQPRLGLRRGEPLGRREDRQRRAARARGR